MSDSNNPYIPVKKLLINNFKSFGKALVEFEKYTVFVTFGDKCVGLIDIIETLQFVLCYDVFVTPDEISKMSTKCSINPETTFVKVQVYDDRTAHTFERKIVNDAFGYMHNEKEVNFDYYVAKLTELHLRTYMSTMFVNLNIMNVFVSFTDIERSEMIEGICGSSLEKPKYDRIFNRLQMNKEELNNAMHRQKYLTSQRNELKKRKRLTDNLNITKIRYEEKRLEFYYFKLFNNQNIVTALEPKVVQTQNKCDALVKNSFTVRKLIAEDEKKRTALYNELKGCHKTIQEHEVQRKKSCLDSYLVEEQIEKLKNDISDLNYVVGQHNVEHIVDTIKMLGDRLQIMKLDKERWNTIYNSVNVLKYLNLQMEFEDKFPEMVVTSRSSVEEMKLISRDINRYNLVLLKQKRLMENLQNSINKLNSDMVKLEEKSETTERNRAEIQNQRKSIEVLTRKIENEMQSKIDDMYKNTFGLNPKQLENIVKVLKSNNSGVFGRISDFARTPNATLQEALKCRFGFRYEAIIVDTKETAHDCISLLKSLNFNEHNETFLFLSGLKLKDTEEFMVDKEGVKDINFEYIENVLSSNMDSIKDALISCASKTVFCKTYEDAVKVFDMEKNNVNVVSTDDQLLFERSGFITKDSKVYKIEISDAELNDLKLKRLEAEQKVRDLTLRTSKTSKMKLMSEISIIKRKLINIIEETNNEHKEAEKIKKIINSLTLKNNTLKQKSNYEGNPTGDEFFAEFCKQFNFPNIGEYRERMLHPITSTTMNGINDRVKACKIELSKKKLNDSMLESLKGSLNFLSMSLLLKSPDKSRCSMQIIQGIKKEILNIELKIKESSNDEHNIHDKLMDQQFVLNMLSLKIEERLRENYEILLDCKKNMIPLEFLRGSLNDIFSLPERDTFINDLMRYRLEKIDVNFDYLSEELKSANGEETCEKLRESFNEIESELVMFPPPEGNVIERINFFSNKLTTCTAIVAKIKSYVDQDEKDFAIVKKVRFEKFVDCLDELNDSVQEFYEQMKDRSTSTAFFSINNEEEPFRDGIKLSFWNAPDLIENEDETFAQAISIILSVIRFNRQKFVIFADIAKFLQEETIYLYQRLFSTDKDYQLVFFTSRPEFQDNSHYTILQKISLTNSLDVESIVRRTIRSSIYSNKD